MFAQRSPRVYCCRHGPRLPACSSRRTNGTIMSSSLLDPATPFIIAYTRCSHANSSPFCRRCEKLICDRKSFNNSINNQQRVRADSHICYFVTFCYSSTYFVPVKCISVSKLVSPRSVLIVLRWTHLYTGCRAKKRGHSAFCRISRKLPKIFIQFFCTHRS